MRARVRYGGAPAQLHADKAYDIAGRPRCAAEESLTGWTPFTRPASATKTPP